MCDLCAKGFFNYEFNSADIDKISNFNEIASNFTYLCTSKFIKYNLTDTDHLLLKSKFYGKGKSGMYFCIFGSCQPLSSQRTQRAQLFRKDIKVDLSPPSLSTPQSFQTDVNIDLSPQSFIQTFSKLPASCST